MQTVAPSRYTIVKIGSLTFFVGASLAAAIRLLRRERPMLTGNEGDYIYIGDVRDGYDVELSEKRLKKCLIYLKLAQSSRNKLRSYGLHNLTKLKNLEDHHCKRIAMLCDYETTVQLARIENVDLRMFAPSLSIHLRQGDLFEILQRLYKTYPESTCNGFFAAMAFKSRERLRTIESSLDEEFKDKYISPRGLYSLCLQALFRYSCVGEETCQMMVEEGLLSCLLTLRENFISDREVHNSIAKLLSQISQYKFSHKHFFVTGWIGILANWMRHDDLELRLTASKILFNLSGNESVLGSHMYLLHPRYSGEQFKYDVVFIHGLLGSIFRTWRQADSEKDKPDYTRCWPESWLPKDINGLRILAIDYHSTLFERKGDCIPEKRSLDDRGEALVNELLAAGVGKRPLILVGHSMGGLLIKQILVNCAKSNDAQRQNLLNQVMGVVFYSVPHRGSELARFSYNWQKIILPSQEVRELIKDSPRLIELHHQFSDVALSRPIHFLSLCEADKSKVGVKGVKVNALLVTPQSADPGFGALRILETNHFNTCKPANPSSPAYFDLVNFIKNIISEKDFSYLAIRKSN